MIRDGFNLILTFATNSGAKRKMVLNDAKETQNPADVRALMQHIVDNDIIYSKGDNIAGIHGAELQKVTTTKIVL